jgi:hypothetical protein
MTARDQAAEASDPKGPADKPDSPIKSSMSALVAVAPAGADPAVLKSILAAAERSGAGPAMGSSASAIDVTGTDSVDVGSVGASGCRASAILARGGPSAVPFDMCCVMAIIRAGGPEPGPLVCGALELLELGEPAESPLVAVAEPAP